MPATFLLSQSPAAGDLLGLWRDEGTAVAFGAPEAAAGVQVWRADLPGDPVGAADRLRACEGRLRRSQERLALADDRLRTAVDRDAFPNAEPDAAWWQAASRDAARMFETVGRALSPASIVETCAGAELVGRSQVGLPGDLRTVWRPEAGAGALLHETTVALTLSSQAALLRMVAVVTGAATAVAARFAVPGGPLLALPAAWRFVQRVLSDPGAHEGQGQR